MTTFQSPVVLSIDIGTSSVRTQLYDGAGRLIPNMGSQFPYSMQNTPDGGAFIELDRLCEWVYEVVDDAVGNACDNKIPIAAVSCCTFWHGMAGIDATGLPCTPLFSWNDTRPETVLCDLTEKLDPTFYTDRTGCPIHASYWPAKIAWLHKAMPEAAKNVFHLMSVGEYILYRITGQRVCSHSMASATGLLNSPKCQWDKTTLEAIPTTLNQVSPLRDANQGVSGLQPQFAKRWPSLRDAMWFPALGDGACSNIGCGCASPDRVAVMVGTSGAMRVVWRGDYHVPPNGLWCYRIDRNRPIEGGALSNGGNLGAWLRDALDFSPYGFDKEKEETLNDIDTALQKQKPDGHGLTFLPFLAGQRSPRWNPKSTGTIHGLRLSTQPIHILQAGLEAVAFRFKLIHDRLKNELSDDHVVVATGGGLLHSSAWVQILADVLGREVQVSTVTEASCRGAALMALESLGAVKDVMETDLCVSKTVQPRNEAHDVYQSALKRHEEFEYLITGRK